VGTKLGTVEYACETSEGWKGYDTNFDAGAEALADHDRVGFLPSCPAIPAPSPPETPLGPFGHFRNFLFFRWMPLADLHNLQICWRYRLSRRKQLLRVFESVSGQGDWSPRFNIAPTQARVAAKMLKPYDARRMRCYPVSPRINHVANDDQECFAPSGTRQDSESSLLVVGAGLRAGNGVKTERPCAKEYFETF